MQDVLAEGLPWSDRLQIGQRPTAELVRPDGHTAWSGDDLVELRGALHRWLGRPSTVPAGR